MKVTDIVLHWGDTRGMQVGIDIGNERDGYRLTVGGYSGDADRYLILVIRVTAIVLLWEDTPGMQVGIDIGNERDGYRLTVGGYSADAGRY